MPTPQHHDATTTGNGSLEGLRHALCTANAQGVWCNSGQVIRSTAQTRLALAESQHKRESHELEAVWLHAHPLTEEQRPAHRPEGHLYVHGETRGLCQQAAVLHLQQRRPLPQPLDRRPHPTKEPGRQHDTLPLREQALRSHWAQPKPVDGGQSRHSQRCARHEQA